MNFTKKTNTINKVLLTGSNGFLGSHTCKYLREKGIKVAGVGRREESVVEIDEYYSCDIDTPDLNKMFESGEIRDIDAVIHFAADMRKEPHNVDVVRSNCTGTQRLLEICERNNIKIFLQLSSLPVIGRPINVPVTENHTLCPPTVYHATKIMEELLADYAMRKHNIRSASFRISAPMGPKVNENTIFPTFIRKAMSGEKIVLSGKGSRIQTYIHARDIAQAIYKSLYSDSVRGIYNLSSFNAISNLELAKKCIKVLDSDSEIIFSGKPDDADNDRWIVSIDKLRKDTSYEPEVGLDECILEYAAWLGENDE